MSKLDVILETQSTEFLSPDDLLDVIEAEEYDDGLCPFRAECYATLGLTNQHCSWNLDNPPTWQFCGGVQEEEEEEMP